MLKLISAILMILMLFSCKENSKKPSSEWGKKSVSPLESQLQKQGIDLCLFYDSLYQMEQPLKKAFSDTGISLYKYKLLLKKVYEKVKIERNLSDKILYEISRQGDSCPSKEHPYLLDYDIYKIWAPAYIIDEEIVKKQVEKYLKDRGLDLDSFIWKLATDNGNCRKEADLLFPGVNPRSSNFSGHKNVKTKKYTYHDWQRHESECIDKKRKGFAKKYNIADSMFDKIYEVAMKELPFRFLKQN